MVEITYQQMLDKLNSFYDRQDKIIKETKKLKTEYEQLEEEIELLQTMIMFRYNKEARQNAK